jgi:hydrogenase maturation protein HypF
VERRVIAIHGIVQGVGFRPYVYGLASRLKLRGFIQNRTGSVRIEVEGEAQSLDDFLTELARKPPPLARIDRLIWERHPPRGDHSFRIEPSEADVAGPIFVSPDVATCADCLAELFNPTDRRYRYPFLNCTNCGPRLTIITGAPYDRPRTTMAGFSMCPACRQEYEDPANRRFHAQPTCCPACGPRLQALDAQGKRIECDDPLAFFVSALHDGRIGALKGLGGYHLVCDASQEAVVAELRRRKDREEKPLALMVRDLAAAEALCEISPAEKELLVSPPRPIVLLRKRSPSAAAEGVAPRNPCLGIMLPYSPLHHRVLDAVAPIPLVMTSGNQTDEPIAHEDRDALARLGDIADVFLTHDRPIHVRCDDSVTRVLDGRELPLRRSRGYAPQPITLPVECHRPILAVGGQLKGTFALGRGHHAFLSHHLGDLDHLEAYRAFVRDIDLYRQLFAIRPEQTAHDLHPDYASTRYAKEHAASEGWSLVPVQHHHAHMASCMAENGLREPAIGVTFDGTGYGLDGAIWGGEFLVGDYRWYQRAAQLRYVGMPGGDRAIREPWRMALAHLVDANVEGTSVEKRHEPVAVRAVRKMLERRFNTPLTSGVGRLFDAVASLAGVRDCVSHEGQAAMELEWLATEVPPDEAYPFDSEEAPGGDVAESPLVIDTRPLIRAVARDAAHGVSAGMIGRRFHSAIVEIIADVCAWLRQTTGLDAVVLSGGVFMNALLTREASARLQGDGFRVFRHRLVPPNDGGLSLGQLAVAAAHDRSIPNAV